MTTGFQSAFDLLHGVLKPGLEETSHGCVKSASLCQVTRRAFDAVHGVVARDYFVESLQLAQHDLILEHPADLVVELVSSEGEWCFDDDFLGALLSVW